MTPEERLIFEQRLAKAIARVSGPARRELLALLGDPPSLDELDAQTFDGIMRFYAPAITPELEAVFTEAVLAQEKLAGIPVGWEIANQRAADWARAQVTQQLLPGMTGTTRQVVNDAVAAYYENAIDRAGLVARVARAFGPERAERIAITEVTRAAAEGAKQYERELNALGLATRQIWQTSNDDLVCPICGPRHGQVVQYGDYPPAHVRCRCWVTTEVVIEEARA